MAKLFSYASDKKNPVVEITEEVLSSWEFLIDEDDEVFEVYSSKKKLTILETMKQLLRLTIELDESFQFVVPLVYTKTKTLTLYFKCLYISMTREGETVLDCGLGSIIDILEYIDKGGEISISFIEKKIDEALEKREEDSVKGINDKRNSIDIKNQKIEKLQSEIKKDKKKIDEMQKEKIQISGSNAAIRKHLKTLKT
jgi:hypothetical protein